jgi:ribose/xylose/arabinose/galactoside ABC-type transport system permease subunit
MPSELDDYMAQLKAETKTKYRDQVLNSLIAIVVGGGLAYWAYGTVAHTLLFAFIVYAITAAKNGIESQMHQFRASMESKRIMDRHGM